MSSALDTFEKSLVAASRTLHEARLGTNQGSPAPSERWRRRGLLRRIRSLSAIAQAGIALGVLTGGAGVALAGYLLFAGTQARRLPSFECEIDGSSTAVANAVTGSPITDCAAIWPSASGGKDAAPRLAIWGVIGGQRLVAVARPLSLGPEPSVHGRRWGRLPDGWTVDLPIVELQDQLANIDQPFNQGIPQSCTDVQDDVARVEQLLRLDDLSGWTVRVEAAGVSQAPSVCRVSGVSVLGTAKTVLLTEFQAPPPSSQAAESRAVRRDRVLRRLYSEANKALSRTCSSVQAAAELWKRRAADAGVSESTLAWWRMVNRNPRTDHGLHYTLYRQPPSQHTGRCAHVLVMYIGDGISNVLVARIRP